MNKSGKLTGMLLSLLLVISCLAASCGGAGAARDSGISLGTESNEPDGYKVVVSEYIIIRPEKATDASLSAAAELKKQLDILTGGDIRISDDWVKDTSSIPADACEILVGRTNRPVSAEAAAAIEGSRFSVSMSGSRIVICAESDALLEAAVEHFITAYAAPSSGSGFFYLPQSLSYTSGEYGSVMIVDSGAPLCNIIYPDGANGALKPEYMALGEAIKKITGTSLTVATDKLSKSGTYDSSSREILLGDTGYPETAEAIKSLAADEYGIFLIGNKIVVCGRTRESSVRAVRKFISLLGSSTTKDADGKVSISLVYAEPLIYKNAVYSAVIPAFTAGTLNGAFDCGDGMLGMYYTGIKEADFEKYCADAATEGFLLTYSHSAAANTFKTYSDGDTRFYITYSAEDQYSGNVRIITGSASIADAPTAAETYSAVCAPSVTQLALSYTADNTNGMGYIIRLSDGSFMIYDGGFTADSETIMNALTRLNATGVKPHIRMWILTHMHGDHTQAFLQFSADHAKDISLDYLALNVADKYYDVDYSNYYTKGTITSALIKFSGAKLLKLHAGTVLRFADAEVEILSTQEELYPGLMSLEFTNDTSVVSRLTLGRQTILFPGDVQTFESDVLVSMYGAYLKSDIVQISHHGSIKYPATIELYKTIAPAWAFFPGSLTRYAENSVSEVNKYLIKESGIKQIFVADKSDRTITLPTE